MNEKQPKKRGRKPKVLKTTESITGKAKPPVGLLDYEGKISSLPNKDLFRIDEVARYFDVSERCIRMWIQHGHLEKEIIQGTTRISRQSILDCRFNKNRTKDN